MYTIRDMSEPLFKPKTLVIILVVLVMASTIGVYRFQQWRTKPKVTVESNENISLEETVNRIGKHFVFNPKEKPVMLMVTEPEKMREANPWFYEHASVGDRVLLWSDQAVLYSVSQDRVLQVLPLNVPTSTLSTLLESQSPKETPSSVATTTILSVEIRNATGKAGEGKKAMSLVDATKYSISTVTDAKNVLEISTVVSSSSIDQARIKSFADQFHATIGSLPVGEQESKADILLFIGKK